MLPVRFLVISLAAILIATSACGGGDGTPPDAQGPRTTEIILDWFVNADHAGLFSAEAGGHFAARGVELETVVPSDPAAALKEVAAGRSDFAVSYQPEVLRARSEGIPVVAVAALVRVPLNSVIVRTDRGITRPRDLAGATVGVTGLPTEKALVRAVVEADGGDPDAVTLRTVGFELGPAIASGRVDAIAGAYWNIELPELAARGIPVDAFRVDDHGVPPYAELVLVTGEDLLAGDPRLVHDVLAGLAAGHRDLTEDTAPAIAALRAANPDLAGELLAAQVEETAPLIAPGGAPPLVLSATDAPPAESWQTFADWMLERGLLDSEIDAATAIDPGFLPDA